MNMVSRRARNSRDADDIIVLKIGKQIPEVPDIVLESKVGVEEDRSIEVREYSVEPGSQEEDVIVVLLNWLVEEIFAQKLDHVPLVSLYRLQLMETVSEVHVSLLRTESNPVHTCAH